MVGSVVAEKGSVDPTVAADRTFDRWSIDPVLDISLLISERRYTDGQWRLGLDVPSPLRILASWKDQ